MKTATTQMEEGVIKTVNIGRGFGFIRRDGQSEVHSDRRAAQRDVFFHCKDLAGGLAFDEQLREMRVHFEIVHTEKGAKAVKVRKAD